MWTLVLALSCAPATGTDTGSDDPGPRRWQSVAQGWWDLCAVDTDGMIACTSPLKHEVVEDCYTTDLSSPPDGEYDSIVMTHPLGGECEAVACAHLVRGGIDCWGRYDYHSDIDFSVVHPSGFDSCGLDPAGTRRCWSVDESVYLPDRSGVAAFASSALTMIEVDDAGVTKNTYTLTGEATVLETGGPWTRVEMSTEALACGLHSDGSVSCAVNEAWAGEAVVAPGPHSGPFTDLCAAASEEVCALREDGSPECWSGEDEVDAPAGPFAQITCGYNSFCGLTEDGAIECWGACAEGECRVPK